MCWKPKNESELIIEKINLSMDKLLFEEENA
jgi:hypothetical protein